MSEGEMHDAIVEATVSALARGRWSAYKDGRVPIEEASMQVRRAVRERELAYEKRERMKLALRRIEVMALQGFARDLVHPIQDHAIALRTLNEIRDYAALTLRQVFDPGPKVEEGQLAGEDPEKGSSAGAAA